MAARRFLRPYCTVNCHDAGPSRPGRGAGQSVFAPTVSLVLILPIAKRTSRRIELLPGWEGIVDRLIATELTPPSLPISPEIDKTIIFHMAA